MRIEQGKTYVDENGKKAGPLIGGSIKYIAGRGGADDPEWENDGTVRIEGEEGYGNLVAEWAEGPVVTETVQRIEPGVYGRLWVDGESKHRFGDLRQIETGLVARGLDNTHERYYGYVLTAPELRELARVALEIAGYLDNA